MIASFLDSWSLFQHSYLAGWLVAILLSVVGVVVVARNQIFLGAAVSQISTLGIAITLITCACFPAVAEHIEHNHGVAAVMAVLFSMLGAVVSSGVASSRESREAVTGWIFLVGASVSILIVAQSPLGMEEIHHLLSSSIIGATPLDVASFGAVALATIVLAMRVNRKLLLLTIDPAMAAAAGLRVPRWETGISVWLGLCVGMSIHSAGLLYTFGCLVLPALVAKHICREVRPMFVVAPIVALASSVAGFVLANGLDVPPGQMTVTILCGLLAAAWTARRFGR